MKLLLTSSGITNPSILNALVDLLGKPIAESSALHHSHRPLPLPWRWTHGMAGNLWGHPRLVRWIGLEVVGSVGADRTAQHR